MRSIINTINVNVLVGICLGVNVKRVEMRIPKRRIEASIRRAARAVALPAGAHPSHPAGYWHPMRQGLARLATC